MSDRAPAPAVELFGGWQRVQGMDRLLQRIRTLMQRGKQYRRVRVAGDYVLLTERQARRYEQLRRRQQSSL